MSLTLDMVVFGGDKRQIYVAKSLAEKGYSVGTYRLSEAVPTKNCTELHALDEIFDRCGVLIGPIPFIKNLLPVEQLIPAFERRLTKRHLLTGGVIPPALMQFCAQNEIACHDFMRSERVAILNAIATAEGAVFEAIEASSINLHGSNCLVLGYGRCGKILAEKLKGLSAKVTVAARSEEALAFAEASGLRPVRLSAFKDRLPDYDFIFNTVPALILDDDCLALLKAETVIIDIASAPGGVDYDAATKRQRNAKLCLGLPGKVAPKASADILVDEIMMILEKRGG